MSEMIERVSRALYPEKWGGHDAARELQPDYWASPVETADRAALLNRGRTAIDAMRVPTDAMAETAAKDIDVFTTYRDAARIVWDRMIDAALKETSHDQSID